MKKNILKISFLVLLAIMLLPLGNAQAICSNIKRGFVIFGAESDAPNGGMVTSDYSHGLDIEVEENSDCDSLGWPDATYYGLNIFTAEGTTTTAYFRDAQMGKGDDISDIDGVASCCSTPGLCSAPDLYKITYCLD